MSDLDTTPDVTERVASGVGRPVAEVYPVRTVPLGGIRGINVERLLPHRGLPTVGAWCFYDHFGLVPGHGTDRIPAPELPNLRLTPRGRHLT
jgi:hypothetical protein